MKRLIFIVVFFLVSVFSFSQIIIEPVDTTKFIVTDTLQYSGYARYGEVFWEGNNIWIMKNQER